MKKDVSDLQNDYLPLDEDPLDLYLNEYDLLVKEVVRALKELGEAWEGTPTSVVNAIGILKRAIGQKFVAPQSKDTFMDLDNVEPLFQPGR